MNEENPCIGICEVEDGYCIGCGRSAEQIFGETDSDRGADVVALEALKPLPGAAPEASD